MSLAVDVNNKLYGWGWGQMMVFDHVINEPKEIKYFKDYIIDEIKCGFVHCYVKTVCEKYFLFGRNGDKECMVVDDDLGYVSRPNQINDIVLNKLNCNIVDIYLGHFNTTIICQSLP